MQQEEQRVAQIYIDPSKPVERITLVFGQRANEMSQDQLIDAAEAVTASIKHYEEANEGVDSQAVANAIAEQKAQLSLIRALLDAQ